MNEMSKKDIDKIIDIVFYIITDFLTGKISEEDLVLRVKKAKLKVDHIHKNLNMLEEI